MLSRITKTKTLPKDSARDATLEWTARKWSTVLHEALNGIEPLHTPCAYSKLQGWSEVILENLMRELRPALLEHSGEGAPVEDLRIRDVNHPYIRIKSSSSCWNGCEGG